MKLFIDGAAGTTGLRIWSRIEGRSDIEPMILSGDDRKDPEARKKALNECDIALLCLPDAAAVEAVGMIENPNVKVIDASTAHRTAEGWAYGFPELSKSFFDNIASSKRVAVTGCHASGFIALVYPLVEAGVIEKSALLTCHSITGYSGGGKKMIADYESEERSKLLDSPRQYGLSQSHKHLPEMQKITGLDTAPIFCPIVADFYSGMAVTVPVFKDQLKCTVGELKDIYRAKYIGPVVSFSDETGEGGFFAANALAGLDKMQISVAGNDDRVLLTALFDNLGKGASGAALECLNIMIGAEPTLGMEL